MCASHIHLNHHRQGNLKCIKRKHSLEVAVAVVIYLVVVSIIPVFNKYFVFREGNFPYPIATAGIQLGVVTLLLSTVNIIDHYRFSRQVEKSWILGPHMAWKLKFCAPIGVLFGFKYAITNVGLHMVSAPTHLLLQATDLVWTVLSAWIINRERVNPVEMMCLLGCIAGSVVLSWGHLQQDDETNNHSEAAATLNTTSSGREHRELPETLLPTEMIGILINLVSPMLLGLCIATLRWACCELMRSDNRVAGTVSAVELTAIKLFLSSIVALVMATVLENDGESWWVVFAGLPRQTQLGITIGGALLIAAFQVNCTWLIKLTSAVSVGLVGQVKIIPQWLVAVWVSACFVNTTAGDQHEAFGSQLSLTGAIFIMGSASIYAAAKFWSVYGPAGANPVLPTQSEQRPLLGG